jgi:hypothetical protein
MEHLPEKFHLTVCLCWEADDALLSSRENRIRQFIPNYTVLPDPVTKRSIQQIVSTTEYFRNVSP